MTGASRGIGAAVAERLATDGFDLVLWARSADGLASTAAAVEAAGGAVRTAVVDVGDADQVTAASAHLAEPLAGVVLNAGSGRWSPLSDVDLDDWDRTLRTNLHGAFHTLRATVPRLVARRAGLIVGVLSDSVLYPHADRTAYSASKAGMGALLESVRREVRHLGVRVSALLPSRVDTHFQGSHADAAPGTRVGALTAAEVAGVVATLFAAPPGVEIRHLQLAAMTATYGPFPERVEQWALTRGH
ncbi:SDR family NAD(P)-dependent oxidoreductase [Actinokineospora sp. NBRC 105648]|uniref:SDR family oxidoreductase n=1 Tax=Actinokineospora sp. NBRC 105648 TaxID=3032206 RepID=UPI002557767B|nr:SDR family NAD(P)-dependent oxidoreductase [Actinokineospora sp. NBRC 105648]